MRHIAIRPSRARLRALATLATLALASCSGHHGGGGIPKTGGGGVSQALWVADGTAVDEFLPSQVAAGGDQTPHLALASASFGSVLGAAFDSSGNLWAIDAGTISAQGTAQPALYEFTPGQLSSLGSNPAPVPTRAINFVGFSLPQTGTFDAGGNLWVTDFGRNAVYEYTPSQLAAGGFNLTPNVQLSANPAFNGPIGVAFDASGNLWVSNYTSNTIDEFAATALPTAFGSIVTLAPNIVLQSNGSSIANPWGLAFDKSGNLWSSNAATATNTVVSFAKTAIVASGKPSVLTISPANDQGNATLAAPNGLAFDSQGDLAIVSSGVPYGVAVFTASQLAGGGALVPSDFLVGGNTTLVTPAGAVFGPTVN